MSSLSTELNNMADELVQCHTNLKNNLIEKGVECSDADKMSNLIDKIPSIPLGKKYASGTLSTLRVYNNNKFATVSLNLSFTPSQIFFTFDEADTSLDAQKIKNITISNVISPSSSKGYVVEISNQYSVSVNLYIADITKTSFNLYMEWLGNARYMDFRGITWYAYE